MGKIKKILENELVGGTQNTDVYPVTSIKAVYDENNERLDNILGGLGDKIGILKNAGYLYAGVATPTTGPGTPNAKVFYIANGKGNYEKFSGIDVTEDEVVVLYYDTKWHKESTGIASQEKLTELKEKVDALDLGAFYGYFPDSASLPTDVTTPGYSYVGLDNPYKIWNFNGESWSDSGTSIDMNDADEEDITRNADGKLQFKDRSYGDGMGYVILRTGKTFEEQVNKANTIYEIRNDFVVSSFTMPQNCVLKFNGGCLSGTLIGDGTSIDAPFTQIFKDATLKGNFVCESVSAEWFGATSVEGSGTYVGGDTISLKPEVDSLADSSSAINKALEFAKYCGGEVVLQPHYYKTTDTISIPDNGTLKLPKNCVIVPYLNGSGLKVSTTDKTTSTATTEELNEQPLYLLENQFIPSDAMSVAISMTSNRCNIVGGGTLFLGKCTFTIGVHLNSRLAYQYTDMTFSPHITITIIGSNKNITASPSSIDIIGSGSPSSDIGNNGDYYYDKDAYKLYEKSSDAWTLRIGGNASSKNLFNTSLRLEANGSDYRIIYPIIELWDMFGFRGIEIITGGTGWINESIIKGTISEKHGSFISIFAVGGGVSIHHWEDITIQVKQVDRETTYDSRIFFASKCNVIFFGRIWDLSYPALPYRCMTIFEMCQKTANVRLGIIDKSACIRISDNGSDNSYNSNPRLSEESLIAPVMFENMLNNRSLAYKSIMSGLANMERIKIPISSYSKFATLTDEQKDSIPIDKFMFDCDNTTYYRAIDTANGIYGLALEIVSENKNNQLRNVARQIWVELDYKPSPNTNGNGKVFAVVGGYNCTYNKKPLKWVSTGYTWSHNMTYKAFFKLDYGTNRIKPLLYVYATEEIANYTLDIVGIKIWTDGSDTTIPFTTIGGITSNRPNAPMLGMTYFNSSIDAFQVNKGDANNPQWVNLAEQTPIVEQTKSNVAIAPNVLNKWGTIESLTITLATPQDSKRVNEYMIEFISGTTPTTINLPTSVKFPSAYTIEANKTYQISIVNNVGLIVGV